VRTGDARLCKGVLAHCLPAICKAVILSLTRGFRALYVSALSCDFGGHVHRDPGNSQIDLMIAHVVELMYSVSACLCSSRLYILLVKKLQTYAIESRCCMEKAVLLHVCSFLCTLAPRMHKIKLHYPWKAFCSAVTILSSSEHCPNLMLTIASL
jgi:hypothetical protein